MHATDTNTSNPLRLLQAYGQSVWLDFIQRDLITSGALARLIDADGIRGMTSNPSIFAKAIAGGSEYAAALAELGERHDGQATAIYEELALIDIRDAADRFMPVYRQTQQRDGYVSLEVSPRLAGDSAATISEARRLWRRVDRPNLMIKVPGTPAGLPAIETLLAEGINVNVTLLFSVAVYRQVMERYFRALETRAAAGADLSRVASVASFFVSRIDSAVDEALGRWACDRPAGESDALQGKAAIANAKLAYRQYQSASASARWQALLRAGARPQRLLWASTSTKNPAYRDVRYVEELIGPDTVNTLPPATLAAFRDHGRVRASLTESVDAAERHIATLSDCGIDLDAITAALLTDGVAAFTQAYEQLLSAIDERVSGRHGAP